MSDSYKYLLKSYVLINASTSVPVALSTIVPASVMSGSFFVFRADVQALFSNKGFVAVGSAPVATNGSTYLGTESGYQLAAGQTESLENIDLSGIFLLPYTASDGIILTLHLRQTS
jgi:hypothetical protein